MNDGGSHYQRPSTVLFYMVANFQPSLMLSEHLCFFYTAGQQVSWGKDLRNENLKTVSMV